MFTEFQAMETALTRCEDEEKGEFEVEEEEEEALSLCDLPLNLIKEENQVQQRNESQPITKTEEDFNFGSLGGSISTEPEMCVADEVFFKGQILPFRLSVSSDIGTPSGFRQDSGWNTSRSLSRSESMDHRSLSRFTSMSSSSRSSSTRSSNSARNLDYTSISTSKSKPIKVQNNFNTHPSPKPQLRLSKTLPLNVCNNRNHKSSMWDIFKLGLVRAPALELQDLKVRSHNNNTNRNSVSRNSSRNSTNSSSSNSNGFLEKKIGLFNGCKCSVNAVETVPLNEKAMLYAAMEEKKKKLMLMQELKAKKEKEKQEGKQASSRHRTFEWLKELSHASYVDEA